jgi:putative hydrolase of the HAD superfamily
MTQAVLLDALGTLMTFEPPAPHLRAEIRGRHGIEVPEQVAAAAMKAEIAYYRAHLHEGRDSASLHGLRVRCAAAMAPVLGFDPGVDTLLAALRFRAYPDAVPALAELRALGLRIVVVSNWDASLYERLDETGLAPLVDGAVASAELGHAKPEPEIFAYALELAGAAPEAALHAGDTLEADVAGALAAGLRAVLVARDGPATAPPGVPVVDALTELPALSQYP